MTAKIVQGVFADEASASSCVQAIQHAGADLGSISVVANIDDFRTVSTELAGRLDKFALACAIIMGVTGGFCGFHFAAHSTVAGSFLLLVPLMGALCGTVAGAYLGLIIGSVLNFDRPTFALPVQQGRMSLGKVVISVRTESPDERYKIEAIMEEHGAIETSSHIVAEETAAGVVN
jgi:hypothetical protein